MADAVEHCRAGRWLLITATDDAGFALVSVASSMDLRIEVACHPAGRLTVADYMAFWNSFAASLGCKRVVFESTRKGWQRLGWQVTGRQGRFIEYSLLVKEGHKL